MSGDVMNQSEFQFGFEKLTVCQQAREFSKIIYQISEQFPSKEKYILVPQIRRAAISISSNISEGTSRFSKKEYAHYIEISFGSLMEVYNQSYLAMDLNYISKDSMNQIKDYVHNISNQLSALRRSILK